MWLLPRRLVQAVRKAPRQTRRPFSKCLSLAVARESIIDGLVQAIILRVILPTAADAEDMHNTAQDSVIILRAGPGWLLGKCRTILAHCSSVNQVNSNHALGLRLLDQAFETKPSIK